MAIKLGTTTASLYLGSTPVAAYLGSEQVYSAATDTVLLLNFNGSNNSTTFTDSSPNGLTVTANGDAKISTAQSKFGGASGLFDGNQDYIQVAQSGNEFEFGAGDFTVEFWMRDNGSPSNEFVSVVNNRPQQDNGVWFGRFDNGATGILIGSSGSWVVNQALSSNAFNGEWNHVAITRSGTSLKVFLNGVQEVSATAGQSITNQSGTFAVGGSPNFGQWFSGYIDDLRVVKGKAVYTANFTPPTAQLGVV
jgi:hypothetical protein